MRPASGFNPSLHGITKSERSDQRIAYPDGDVFCADLGGDDAQEDHRHLGIAHQCNFRRHTMPGLSVANMPVEDKSPVCVVVVDYAIASQIERIKYIARYCFFHRKHLSISISHPVNISSRSVVAYSKTLSSY